MKVVTGTGSKRSQACLLICDPVTGAADSVEEVGSGRKSLR